MKIKIEKQSDHYRADCLDLPGSSPVGLGKTKELAVAHLFYRVIFESTGGTYSRKWIDFLSPTELITVDDIVWRLPLSYLKG